MHYGEASYPKVSLSLRPPLINHVVSQCFLVTVLVIGSLHSNPILNY